MQTSDQLNQEFAIPGRLRFDEPHPGMPRAVVELPTCSGELFLHGAHVTGWQPTGQQPVLYLSERSAFAPEKAIRGGIPVIFPWFGSPETSPVSTPPGSPSHGYARISPWTLRFAALAGDDLHLSLTLDATEQARRVGLAALQAGIEITFGKVLTVRLTIANADEGQPLLFEEALHTYLHVSNVAEVSVDGLGGTEYLDKPDGFARKRQPDAPIRFNAETDRVYLNTGATVSVVDPLLERRLSAVKTASQSTIVWNPAEELTRKLTDLLPEAWRSFACVETANVSENAIRLQPREVHTMTLRLHADPLAATR